MNQYDSVWNLVKRILVAQRVVKPQEIQGYVAKQKWGGGQDKQAMDLGFMDGVIKSSLHLIRRNVVKY